MSSVKRLTLAAFGVALLALVLAAAPAFAQRGSLPINSRVGLPNAFGMGGTGGTLNPYNYYDPYGFSRQAAFNIALYGQAMSQVPPYALGYNPYPTILNTPLNPTVPYGAGSIVNNPALYTSPGYNSPGYGGYGGGYGYSPYYPNYYDPYSGFLQGAASVISADGQFRINNQQANLMREQVRSAHIDNNRKAFDEFLYERANRPTWLDDMERQRKFDLRYVLSNPSGSEILQGNSLNTLLEHLKQMQGKGVDGPAVALNEDLLSQINVTAGAGVNPGLLKTDKLTWPVGLMGGDMAESRKRIERNLATAISEVEHGQLEPARLKDLTDAVDKISEDLNSQITEVPPSQYIDARNYLRFLNDAVRALGRPDAAKYINNQYAAKGKTVSDLVRNMSGLRFAPATPGAERAYKDLYEKLVSYYNRAQPSTRGEHQ
jgi:hypothetical protein